MIRVLICAPKLFEPGSSGGGERYVSEFVAAMRSQPGIEVTVVSGIGYRGLMKHADDSGDDERLDARELRRLVAGASVVHLFQLDSHVADLVLASSLRTGTPVVLSDLGGGWRSIGRVLGAQRLRMIDGLAAISHVSALDLGWPLAKPFRVIYGGGDHILRSVDPTSRPNHGDWDVAFVGRLIPHKGPDLLLRALPDSARCVVAGSAMDHDYIDSLRRLASGKDVKFVSSPADSDVAAVLAGSRISVSPTRSVMNGKRLRRPELLGLSAIESMTLGTPCVLSDIPAFGELATITGMPTFTADDVDSLREVLQTALSDPPPIDHRRLATLTWGGAAQECVRLYAEVIASAAR
ncbi:glycosyltransferase family 4 protein [Nocardioides rubriscoriae]|uniref:glycosyltransferase family 4 protein n=1 Tax=Nocardioides rubriscoriae TaxID=642762 RepID=UPI0011DFB0FF|nr:glycosyltransferase family 4 protein [Nocardioides rubriscoriae]